MPVSPVMNSSSTSSGSTDSSSINDITNNFMTLLVAQMQNQDPTNPMDNNQLTSQLAQLNTASGIQQLNTTLNNVGTLVTSMQQMNAAEWVGRDILIEGTPKISTKADGNKEFALSLNKDADEIAVTLTNSAGEIYTATLKDVKAGVHKYSLEDLKNIQPADPGDAGEDIYTVSFTAKNTDGSAPDITALKKAKVESVAFTAAGAELQLGLDGTASLGNVYMIE